MSQLCDHMQGCRICHLDRPYGSWPQAVTSTPAAAMKLPDHGRLRVGGPANLVVFRGRKYSELLSRPQYDRVRFSVAPTFIQCLSLHTPQIHSMDRLVAEGRLENGEGGRGCFWALIAVKVQEKSGEKVCRPKSMSIQFQVATFLQTSSSQH